MQIALNVLSLFLIRDLVELLMSRGNFNCQILRFCEACGRCGNFFHYFNNVIANQIVGSWESESSVYRCFSTSKYK